MDFNNNKNLIYVVQYIRNGEDYEIRGIYTDYLKALHQYYILADSDVKNFVKDKYDEKEGVKCLKISHNRWHLFAFPVNKSFETFHAKKHLEHKKHVLVNKFIENKNFSFDDLKTSFKNNEELQQYLKDYWTIDNYVFSSKEPENCSNCNYVTNYCRISECEIDKVDLPEKCPLKEIKIEGEDDD